jgi:glycosyltransferase involved in cell wall biosynthesis
MRIVIDMQGAQTESQFRGIGRYTLSFSQAVVGLRGEHEIILALNGLFPETIEPIRAAFDGLLPQENIRVWYAPGPVREFEPGNESRREAAEKIREAFLASLSPDVIHISSLFEGYCDDAVTSIGRFDETALVSVTLYDLIPLLNPDHYLTPNPHYAEYYQRKLDYFKRAALHLAISESSRQEGIAYLGLPVSRAVNTSIAIEAYFRPISVDDASTALLRQRFGLTRPFVLCAGGADERKNLPRLIQAFAAMPRSLRAGHHLVLAGKMPDVCVSEFKQQAEMAGLNSDDVRFTGYITDEELVQLYNLCKLFVFPSWHEGFGLPALEAMACGAPVLGSNTSSVPEVIGLDAAMFDPFNVAAIMRKMALALEDDDFRSQLREQGFRQAKKFSWDESAKRAIRAWESLQATAADQYSYLYRSVKQARTIHAVARHLPAPDPGLATQLAACLAKNQNTSIERQLLLDVSELSQRDAATGVQRVVRSYLKALLESPPKDFRVEPVYATRDEGYRYARRFTQRFLGQNAENVTDDPVHWQRADVFFGLDMQHHVQLAHREFIRRLQCDGVTVKFLVHDLLPIQLASLFKDFDARVLHEQWLAMIAGANGAICVSKATADAFDNWITENNISRAPNFQITWVHNGADIEDSKPSMGLPMNVLEVLSAIQSRPSFLCVATLEPRKRQDQILSALELLWDEGLDLNLVFVGQQGWKTENLVEKIMLHPEKDRRLYWLLGISDEYLHKVYNASACLIAASVNEGFGLPLIEAARQGIPIVARDIPVFHEVAGECAFYFDGDTHHELANSLKDWLDLYQRGSHPKSDQMRWSTWHESAEKLKNAIFQENYPRRQLLVDISELAQRDARSGIQRVVRNVLKEWLNHPPAGYRVEPVYATTERDYRYARRFTHSFLGYPGSALRDEPIDYAPGDIFFGLDLQPQVVAARRAFYQVLRSQGVRVEFLVHDLLSIQMPQYFSQGNAEGFTQWLTVVAESDGAVCVSKTVANQLAAWVEENGVERQRTFRVNWSHNGADIADSLPARRLPPDAGATLDRITKRHTFLMVGTVEPRKAHEQVLHTFEALWRDHCDFNLVFVGKQGWMAERFIDRLRAHSELNRRLFWLDGISDEYLDKVYAASTCLIAASEGEGFGLPLIEAAQHKTPIIARDIPVFREVGGDCVYYFSNDKSPEALAKVIKEWLRLYTEGKHPKSDGLPYLTWTESAKNLLDIILGNTLPYKLLPELSKDPDEELNLRAEKLKLNDWSAPEPRVPWSLSRYPIESSALNGSGMVVMNHSEPIIHVVD